MAASIGGDIDTSASYNSAGNVSVTADANIPGAAATTAVTLSFKDSVLFNNAYVITVGENNSGVAGSLLFSGASTSYFGQAGTLLDINAGGTVHFTDQAYDPSAGDIRINGGSLLFDSSSYYSGSGPVSLSSGTLSFDSDAYYSGSGDLEISGGSATFNNAIYSGSGGLRVSGGILDFTGSASHNGAGSFTITGGTTTFHSGSSLAQPIYPGPYAPVLINGGSLVFKSGSTFTYPTTIDITSGSLSLDTSMAKGFSKAFNATAMSGSSAVTNITGATGANTDLVIGSAVAGSQVNIVDGGQFAGMNVKNADLNVQKDTTFTGSVGAENVNTAGGNITFTNQLAVANALNVSAGQAVLFSGQNANFAAGTANNQGTVTFTHGGGYSSSGTFNNHGTVNADASMTNMKNLAEHAVLFTGSRFNITNTSGIAASIPDLVMGSAAAGSQVNIVDGGLFAGMNVKNADLNVQKNTTFTGSVEAENVNTAGGNITFTNQLAVANALNVSAGQAVLFSGQNANFAAGTTNNQGTVAFTNGGGYSSSGTFNNHGTVNADASMTNMKNLAKHAVLFAKSIFNITDTKGGSTLSDLDFSAGATNSEAIINVGSLGATSTLGSLNAGMAQLNLLGKINVSPANIITSGSSLTVEKSAQLLFPTLGANTTFITSPNVTIAGFVSIGGTNTLQVDGNVTFLSGSKLRFNADSGGISKIIAVNGGRINIDGPTAVFFTGATNDILDKEFLIADDPTLISDISKLTNPIYDIDYSAIGVLAHLHVKDRKPTIDTIWETAGSKGISINKHQGSKYIDNLVNAGGYKYETELNDYLQELGGTSQHTALTAFSQLFGEYAAYANYALLHANRHFSATLNNHMELILDLTQQPTPEGSASTASLQTDSTGRIWGSALGEWSKQRDRGNINGADYTSAGLLFGYELQSDNTVVGVATSYSRGETKINDQRTTIDSDMLNVGLYGQHTHDSGLFARGRLGAGYGWNDYDVKLIMSGKKTGSYENWLYNAGMDLGYMLDASAGITIVPSIGAAYTYVQNDSWSEHVHGSDVPGNRFQKSANEFVQFPLTVRVNKTITFDNGDWLKPEIRGGWIGQTGNEELKITTGFVGDHSSATMQTVNSGRQKITFGGGVTGQVGAISLSLDYNLEAGRKYKSHDLTCNFGFSF